VKLWIVSDLHLDLRKDFVAGAQRPSDFDVLVVAGDVVDGDVVRGIETTAAMAGDRPAIYVAGNHCYWGYSFQDVRERGMEAGARTGLHFLQNSTVDIDGVIFFGATLWEPMLRDPRAPRPNLSAIMSGKERDPAPHSALPVNEPIFVQGPDVMDRRAKIRDIQREFEISRVAMKQASANVVVTHYPPTYELLQEINAPMWIHGHEHRVRDELVSGTRILANAIGMPSENRRMDNLCTMVIDTDDLTLRRGFP
jgi:predicted phosphodiesterase